MNCRAIVFDLDGTLADTLSDLAQALNFALASFGQPTHPLEACKQMIGDGMSTLARRALPTQKQDLSDEIAVLTRRRYSHNCFANTRLYEGVYETVGKLRKKGIRLAVLTNKDQGVAKQIVEHFFGPDTFEYIVGVLGKQVVKPHGRAIKKLIQLMKLTPADMILVGDSGVDMKTAAAAGIRAVAVAWGFCGRDELVSHKPTAIIDKPAELLNLLG